MKDAVLRLNAEYGLNLTEEEIEAITQPVRNSGANLGFVFSIDSDHAWPGWSVRLVAGPSTYCLVIGNFIAEARMRNSDEERPVIWRKLRAADLATRWARQKLLRPSLLRAFGV